MLPTALAEALSSPARGQVLRSPTSIIGGVPLAAGTRLGVFDVIGPLGAGGMGAVYRARDTRLDRFVAIKVMTEALAGDQELRARFEQEARAVAALNHPHICTIHDVGREGETDYLVMELLDGETLAARIARGTLGVAEAIDIAIQIGEALDAAHRAGIVHRDLKPGNVMLVRSGTQNTVTAKLLDFGVAATMPPGVERSRDESTHATMAASMVATRSASGATPLAFSGTVQYMAPEQMEGWTADGRSDIFAFGCVLYEMLAGRKAFVGASVAVVVAAVMGSEPLPIERLASEPLLEHVLRRCLAKDRERRWQSIRDVIEELRFAASQPTRVVRATAPAKQTVARTVAIAALAAIGTLVLAGGLWWARGRTSPTPPMELEVTTPATNDLSMALSGDGKFLVFVANQNGRPMLWLRSLDKVGNQPLPHTEGATLPFWSPDGRSVGFFADGKLKRTDIAGGATFVLGNAPNPRGGDWGPDGTILFAPDVSSALMRVSSSGGTPSAVTKAPEGHSHRRPQFLTDGKRFIFHWTLGTPEVNGIYLGFMDGTAPKRLLPTDTAARFVPPDRLLVVRQGALMALRLDLQQASVRNDEPLPLSAAGLVGQGVGDFATSVSGAIGYRGGGGQLRRLVWVDRMGTELAQATGPMPNNIGSPELSPDEKSATVFLGGATDNDIAIIDLARNLRRFVTSSPPADAHPLWDPDGQHILFSSSRFGAVLAPSRVSIDGNAKPERFFPESVRGVALSWTKDRQTLLVRRDVAQTGPDLFAVSLDGKQVPVAESTYAETEGQFSPDGKWIAYVSNENGHPEVYLQSFPRAGGHTQVSIEGGTQVRWAASGKEIFYLAPGGAMTAVAVTFTNGAAEVTRPVTLFPTHLASGTNVIGNKPQYAVSRDGRFLLNSLVESASLPIVVSLNRLR